MDDALNTGLAIGGYTPEMVSAVFPSVRDPARVARMLNAAGGLSIDFRAPMATQDVVTASVGVPTPEEIRERKLFAPPVQQAIRPAAPSVSIPEAEHLERIYGITTTWRDSIMGMVGSKTLSLLSGMLQGVTDLVRIAYDNTTLQKMSEWFGKPVEEEAKRAAIQTERAFLQYGLAGRTLAQVTNTALDVGLFLLAIHLTGGAKGLLSSVKYADKASRAAMFFGNVEHAAKFAALRFITTPGDAEEKAKAAAMSFAYTASPALSGQLGRISTSSARSFLQKLWRHSVIPADFAINSLVTGMTGQYEEAMKSGQAEADAMGRPELGFTFGLLNLIPLVGTDVVFASMTRGFWRYQEALAGKLPEPLRSQLGEKANPSLLQQKAAMLSYIEKNMGSYKAAGVKIPDTLYDASVSELSGIIQFGEASVKTKKAADDAARRAAEREVAKARKEAVTSELLEGKPLVLVTADHGIKTQDELFNLLGGYDKTSEIIAVGRRLGARWVSEHRDRVCENAELGKLVIRDLSKHELRSVCDAWGVKPVKVDGKIEQPEEALLRVLEKAPQRAGEELPAAIEGPQKVSEEAPKGGEGDAVHIGETKELSPVETSGSVQKVGTEVRQEDSTKIEEKPPRVEETPPVTEEKPAAAVSEKTQTTEAAQRAPVAEVAGRPPELKIEYPAKKLSVRGVVEHLNKPDVMQRIDGVLAGEAARVRGSVSTEEYELVLKWHNSKTFKQRELIRKKLRAMDQEEMLTLPKNAVEAALKAIREQGVGEITVGDVWRRVNEAAFGPDWEKIGNKVPRSKFEEIVRRSGAERAESGLPFISLPRRQAGVSAEEWFKKPISRPQNVSVSSAAARIEDTTLASVASPRIVSEEVADKVNEFREKLRSTIEEAKKYVDDLPPEQRAAVLESLRGGGAETGLVREIMPGEAEGEIDIRFQRSISGGKPISIDEAVTQVRSMAEVSGGEFVRTGQDPSDIGSIKYTDATIRFLYTDPEAVAAGQVRTLGAGEYEVMVSPQSGRITTVAHEAGHIMRDLLTGDEIDAIRQATGIDVSTRDGDEAFASKIETAEGRKELAEQISRLGQERASVLVRAVNKVIDFVNLVFGTKLRHIGAPAELERLAEDVEGFALLRRLSATGSVGLRQEPAAGVEAGEVRFQEQEESAGRGWEMPLTYRSAMRKKNVALVREFEEWRKSKSPEERGETIAEAWGRFRTEKDSLSGRVPEETLARERASDDILAEVMESAKRFPRDVIDPETGKPVPRSLFRRALDAIGDVMFEFTNMVPAGDLLSPRLAEGLKTMRQRAGQDGDILVVRLIDIMREMEGRIKEYRSAEPIYVDAILGGDVRTGNGGKPSRLKLEVPEAMSLAMYIEAERSEARKAAGSARSGKSELAGLTDRFVLGRSANGQADRVWHLTEEQKDAVLGALTPQQRADATRLAQYADEEVYPAIAAEFKARTGRDLTKREFYQRIVRDISFMNRPEFSSRQERERFEDWAEIANKRPLTYGLTPEGEGFLRDVRHNELPIIVGDIFARYKQTADDAAHFIKASRYKTWIEANILGNKELVNVLSGSTPGRQLLQHFRDMHDKVGGVINLGLDSADRALSNLLERATVARLGSPWVIVKQPMSVFSGCMHFGLEYLPYIFSRNTEEIVETKKRSAYLRRRKEERTFDPFMTVSGLAGQRGDIDPLFRHGRRIVAWMMEKGDSMAINGIIHMAAKYVRDKWPNLTGEEYWRTVAAEADKATQFTQVATDALDRSMFERNITSPVKKLLVYMYGARSKQYNLIMMALRRAWYRRDAESMRSVVTAFLTVGLAQSTTIALWDLIRSRIRADSEDEVGNMAAALAVLSMESILGTVPLLGDFIPAVSSAAYTSIGEKTLARLRSARIGQGGIFSQAARDAGTLISFGRQWLTLEKSLREAKTPAKRRAIKQRLREKTRMSMKVVTRIFGEVAGVPYHHVVLELFPKK